MDDGFEFFVFCILLPILAVCLIFSLVGLATSVNEDEKKKDDKRYELCINKDKQWVDGNCIGTK